MFKKPYIFIIELIVVALVVGWMLYSFPDIVGRYIPFLVLVVVWHLSWEIVKHDSVKALLLSSPVARWNRMFVYGLIFIAGGLLSILYWWGITKGLSELATAENAFRVTHEHKATTEAQPQPMVPADHSPDKNQQGEIEKEILAKLDAIQKSVGR